MKKIKITEPYSNLYHFEFENQYELTSTFLRLQEFYESPFKECRGKFFTLEDYMDLYAASRVHKNFTYYTDWSGFNVPGTVVVNFFRTYGDHVLSKKERKLAEVIFNNIDITGPFYIIATYKNDEKTTQDHEIAHGLYHLNESYREEMDLNVKDLKGSERKKFTDFLRKAGYTKEVFDDEIQAYAATSSKAYLEKKIGLITPPTRIIISEFRKIFKKYTKN